MFSLCCHLMWFVEITIYRLPPMVGNEVTLNDQDQAACLRDSGFVQVCHEQIRKDLELYIKMKVGPSESAFGSGFQTTQCCCGKEPW